MKKNSANTNLITKSTRISSRKTATKKGHRYLYTEADLGEDILNISLCSVYSAAKQLVQNMYSRMYAFQ